MGRDYFPGGYIFPTELSIRLISYFDEAKNNFVGNINLKFEWAKEMLLNVK